MQRNQYLEDSNVHAFTEYLSDLIAGSAFHHDFKVVDPRLPTDYEHHVNGHLHIKTLQHAFQCYWWNRKGFDKNQVELQSIALEVSNAIKADTQATSLAAVKSVLRWGAGGTALGLYTQNMKWAERAAREGQLTNVLQSGRDVMASTTPNARVFADVANGPRMNAGFTKYYALACENVVIYDGRVGSALGLLVRKFCECRKLNTVPATLAFRWGAKNTGNGDPIVAKQRDPSVPPYKFLQLRGGASGSRIWAEQNIRANWILAKAIKNSQSPGNEWCKGKDGLRRLEAALFTIGYSMRSDAGASK